MRASSSTASIMTAIVALALLLAALLAYAFVFTASDDAGAASVAAAVARLAVAVQPPRWRRGYRSSCPEVVGMSSEEAKKRICEDWTCDNVHIIPAGYSVTMDYNTRRVRVFLDSNNKVASVRIG